VPVAGLPDVIVNSPSTALSAKDATKKSVRFDTS